MFNPRIATNLQMCALMKSLWNINLMITMVCVDCSYIWSYSYHGLSFFIPVEKQTCFISTLQCIARHFTNIVTGQKQQHLVCTNIFQTITWLNCKQKRNERSAKVKENLEKLWPCSREENFSGIDWHSLLLFTVDIKTSPNKTAGSSFVSLFGFHVNVSAFTNRKKNHKQADVLGDFWLQFTFTNIYSALHSEESQYTEAVAW